MPPGMNLDAERPDVSAVIVHFETPDLLRACLAALLAARGARRVEIFVVDNASKDFDADEWQRLNPDVRIVRNEQNRGFSVAANQGLALATGRYLLLLNPDTIVATDTLETMITYLEEHPDVGCATARLELENGRLDLACRRSFPTPMRAFYRISMLSRLFPRTRRFGAYDLTYLDEHQEAEIDTPCGAFMFVRHEVLDQVGPLDERYFMYGEDMDWAMRMKRAEWRVMYTPSTTVRHVKRASSRHSRPRTIHAFHDAMRIFYREYYQNAYPRWLSWAVYRSIDVREALELSVERLRGA